MLNSDQQDMYPEASLGRTCELHSNQVPENEPWEMRHQDGES
jgi:hypothetical protein